MLLRCASTPILKSWLVKDPSLSESLIVKSTSGSAILSSSPLSRLSNGIPKISRTSSEYNLKHLSKDKEDNHAKVFDLGLSISAMSLESMVLIDSDGGDGGRLRGGAGGGRGGGGGGGGGGDECSDSNHEFDRIDEYYQEMIKANPTDALLLQNYAKFLKEVKGEYVKAEEYCGRAILANANDGEILSLYGELMWDIHKNAELANFYFDRALQAAPHDSYITASYARYVWDAEEDEDDHI